MARRKRVPFEWHTKQRGFLRAVRDNDLRGPKKFACLGGWGSGKTVVGAGAFGLHVMSKLAGDAEGYRPQTAVFAPTARVLEKAVMPILEKVIPREAILKKQGRPYPTWKLVNGVDVSFVSAEAMFEGESLAAIWVDEVHKLASNPNQFQNYIARLRDPQAPHLALFATGLPEAGWTRDTFDPMRHEPEDRDLIHTVLMGTSDNPFLPKDLFRQFLASCPAGYQESLIGGGWMQPEDAMYDMFSEEHNIVSRDRWDRGVPANIGIDAGVSSAAVVAQPVSLPHGRGVLIGGDFTQHSGSLATLCEAVRGQFGGQIVAGQSTICVDPTLRSDEVAAIRRVFPGVYVKIRPRSDPWYSVDPGIRLVQAALCNAAGQRHLLVSESCRGTKKGIISAWLNLRRSPRTGNRVKDDVYDHVDDACRYLLNYMLGDHGFAPEVKK